MKALYDLRGMICDEIDKMAKKGKIASTSELDLIDKLTHSLKSVDTILAMDEAQNDGYSGDGYSEARGRGRYARRDSMGRYSRDEGRSYDGGSYRDGGSYGRDYSRDGGSYGDGGSYRGGYSSAAGDMMDKMRRMMEQAGSEEERKAIRKIMVEMEK